MPHTLSAPTTTATQKPVTQPGFLMQAGFAFPIRYSSRRDVTFNGQTFIAANLKVGAIKQQANGAVTLQATVGNSDGAFGAVCLAEAPQEKAISIWKFYEGATGAADPFLYFSGAIDSVSFADDRSSVSLTLSSLNQGTLFIPRRRISADTGFNRLLPAGRVLFFDGVRLDINRDVS